MSVTAETITDWQIRESGALSEDIRDAQGQEPRGHVSRYRWQCARARCAAAYNARHGDSAC